MHAQQGLELKLRSGAKLQRGAVVDGAALWLVDDAAIARPRADARAIGTTSASGWGFRRESVAR